MGSFKKDRVQRLVNRISTKRWRSCLQYLPGSVAEPDIFIWGATGGASFATRGAVNGLCRTFIKRPEKFWGGHWGARQNFGAAVAPPGTPLAPPLTWLYIDLYLKM